MKDSYLSNESIRRSITNIDTGIKIEVWKKGIKETFGNDKYYMNLSEDMKKLKIVSMEYLAMLIKYSKKRSNDAKNYHNPNSKIKFAYLETFICIDGINYYVTIDIKKSPKGENRFYIHNLSIKNEDNLSQSHSD